MDSHFNLFLSCVPRGFTWNYGQTFVTSFCNHLNVAGTRTLFILSVDNLWENVALAFSKTFHIKADRHYCIKENLFPIHTLKHKRFDDLWTLLSIPFHIFLIARLMFAGQHTLICTIILVYWLYLHLIR